MVNPPRPPLHHISLRSLTEPYCPKTILRPRIPMRRQLGEDGETPRICFATSINGCLNALPLNAFGSGHAAWPLYVYSPVAYADSAVVSSDALVSKITDVHLTGEIWIIQPVEVVLVGIIITTDRHLEFAAEAATGKIFSFYRYDFDILCGNLENALTYNSLILGRRKVTEALSRIASTIVNSLLAETHINPARAAITYVQRFLGDMRALISPEDEDSLIDKVTLLLNEKMKNLFSLK